MREVSVCPANRISAQLKIRPLRTFGDRSRFPEVPKAAGDRMHRLFTASEVKLPWTIFLYTNNYLRDFDPSCKDFIHILGMRPCGPHDRFGGRAFCGLG